MTVIELTNSTLLLVILAIIIVSTVVNILINKVGNNTEDKIANSNIEIQKDILRNIEKLKKKGIMVFRTDLDGAVGIIHRKGKLSVCTEKQR